MKKSVLILLVLTAVGLPLFAASVYFSVAPSSAPDGTPYYVEATASGGNWGEPAELWLYKNSNYLTSNYGSGWFSAGATETDSGPQTVEYFAEVWDYVPYSTDSAWLWVSINAPANQAPQGVRDYSHATVGSNGNLHGSGWATDNEMGAPITRVDILIDGNDVGDANLGGYRPDVADAFGRPDYTYSGWSFDFGVNGLSVGPHSLELRAWDNQGVSSNFGYTTFQVTMSAPNITLLSPAAQSVTLNTALTISSNATDGDGDITTHNLDIQRPDGTWNWQGGFATGEPFLGGPVGSGSNSTRNASFVFNQIGTWYVRSWVSDSAGNNLHSATVAISVVDTTPPTVPTGLSASAITSTSFTLNWAASSDNVGVAAYEVFRNGISLGTTASTSFSVTGLSAGSSYSITVRAADAAGNWSAQSSALTVVAGPDNTAPSVPAGLGRTSPTVNSFVLTWSASSDNVAVTSYEVFKGGVSIGTTSALSFSVTGLAPATAYSMTVRACDAAGNWSAQSAAYSASTAADTSAPTIPAGLASASIGATSFTLSWGAASDDVAVTSYEVFRDGVSLGWAAGLNRSITGLTPATTYAMTVRARDAAGNMSAQCAAFNVTTATDSSAPTTPGSLSASSVTVISFTLNWAASTDNIGVTGYEVFRNGTSLGTAAGLSRAISSLNPGTAYTMTVKARDAAGNFSAASSPLVVTTPADTQAPTVPTGMGSNSTTPTSFNLTWSPSTDNVAVAQYEVFRGGVSQGTLTGTTKAITGLAPSTSYSMQVKSRDTSGNWSALSSSFVVTTPADTQAPTVPSGLTDSLRTSNTFTLTWSASSDNIGVTAYEIRRDSTTVASQPGTTFNLTSLSPNTSYSMTVRARDAANNWSAWSSALVVTTTDDTDNDTLPDTWERKYTGGLQYSASADPFAVGRTLLQSYQGGLSPLPAAVVTLGLQAWYRADLGITKDGSNSVSQWLDASGGGRHLNQATTTSQPLWIASAQNGKPAVEFEASEKIQSAASALQSGSSDFTVITVLIPSASQGSSQPVIIDLDADTQSGFSLRKSGTGYSLRWRNQAQTAWEGETAPQLPLTASTVQLFTYLKNGSSQIAYKDAVQGSTATVGSTMTTPTAALSLGASVSTSLSYFNGRIAEVLIYNRALTQTERQQVESSLITKYNLPVSDSDGDGLPDSWEMARFGTLAYSGTSFTEGSDLDNAAKFRAESLGMPAGGYGLVLRTPGPVHLGVKLSDWSIATVSNP